MERGKKDFAVCGVFWLVDCFVALAIVGAVVLMGIMDNMQFRL